jgi:hypothetical protein
MNFSAIRAKAASTSFSPYVLALAESRAGLGQASGLVGGEFDAALADAGGKYGGDGGRL